MSTVKDLDDCALRVHGAYNRRLKYTNLRHTIVEAACANGMDYVSIELGKQMIKSIAIAIRCEELAYAEFHQIPERTQEEYEKEALRWFTSECSLRNARPFDYFLNREPVQEKRGPIRLGVMDEEGKQP